MVKAEGVHGGNKGHWGFPIHLYPTRRNPSWLRADPSRGMGWVVSVFNTFLGSHPGSMLHNVSVTVLLLQ